VSSVWPHDARRALARGEPDAGKRPAQRIRRRASRMPAPRPLTRSSGAGGRSLLMVASAPLGRGLAALARRVLEMRRNASLALQAVLAFPVEERLSAGGREHVYRQRSGPGGNPMRRRPYA
jgi:hypothetical protein